MRALSIASTGMSAQQTNVETIANNLANMNTTGFKEQRAEFQDLLYQNVQTPGSQTSDAGTVAPNGIQLGAGVRTSAIYRITQNRKDARDVFQESISIALLHLNQFKLDSSFSTWLTRIGINCALMRRRRTSAENLRSAVSC